MQDGTITYTAYLKKSVDGLLKVQQFLNVSTKSFWRSEIIRYFFICLFLIVEKSIGFSTTSRYFSVISGICSITGLWNNPSASNRT